MGPPYGKRDPYHSHIFRDSNMGIVWVPLTIFGGPMSFGGSRSKIPTVMTKVQGNLFAVPQHDGSWTNTEAFDSLERFVGFGSSVEDDGFFWAQDSKVAFSSERYVEYGVLPWSYDCIICTTPKIQINNSFSFLFYFFMFLFLFGSFIH